MCPGERKVMPQKGNIRNSSSVIHRIDVIAIINRTLEGCHEQYYLVGRLYRYPSCCFGFPRVALGKGCLNPKARKPPGGRQCVH